MKPWHAQGGPGGDVLRRLVFIDDLTDQQIADLYNVASATVRYWRRRSHIDRGVRYAKLDHKATGAIPWEINTTLGHHRDPLLRILRDRNRHLHGFPVAHDALARAEQTEHDLRELGLVIDYDRQRGFFTRSRDDQDAPDAIVRVPRET